eukprot:391707-Amphidinium_carterae.1
MKASSAALDLQSLLTFDIQSLTEFRQTEDAIFFDMLEPVWHPLMIESVTTQQVQALILLLACSSSTKSRKASTSASKSTK